MAQRACLELGCLVVEGWGARCGTECRVRVALEAEQVYRAQAQHVRVWPAVRNVAGLATFHLDGIVLEDEGALLIRVTLEADGVLLCGRAHLVRLDGAVRVVTIRAVDKPFVHAMVKGHFELGLLGLVASDAELRLRSREQKLSSFRVVRGMARDATDVGLPMQ